MASLNIYRKLARVKSRIGDFVKDMENEDEGFTYAGLAKIFREINRENLKEGLLLNVEEMELVDVERMIYKFRVTLTDTKRIEIVKTGMVGQEREFIAYTFWFPMDNVSDYANKAIRAAGATITTATRYIYQSIYSIQLVEDVEEEAAKEGGTAKEETTAKESKKNLEIFIKALASFKDPDALEAYKKNNAKFLKKIIGGDSLLAEKQFNEKVEELRKLQETGYREEYKRITEKIKGMEKLEQMKADRITKDFMNTINKSAVEFVGKDYVDLMRELKKELNIK